MLIMTADLLIITCPLLRCSPAAVMKMIGASLTLNVFETKLMVSESFYAFWPWQHSGNRTAGSIIVSLPTFDTFKETRSVFRLKADSLIVKASELIINLSKLHIRTKNSCDWQVSFSPHPPFLRNITDNLCDITEMWKHICWEIDLEQISDSRTLRYSMEQECILQEDSWSSLKIKTHWNTLGEHLNIPTFHKL